MEALILRIQALKASSPSCSRVEDSIPLPQETAPPQVQIPATPVFLGAPRCPSCGSSNLTELKKNKRITPAEKVSVIFSLWRGNYRHPCFFVVAVLFVTLQSSFPLISDDTCILAVILATLVGAIGGYILSNRICLEQIRRQRVRKHIRTHPFRCDTCCKVFLIKEE